MRKIIVTTLTLVLAQVLLVGCSSTKSEAQAFGDGYDVAAYVWPSCHHDQRLGDIPWPDGVGEWEIIKKGTPRFEGHYQPKVPLWGYEPDDDPKVMERWIEERKTMKFYPSHLSRMRPSVGMIRRAFLISRKKV